MRLPVEYELVRALGMVAGALHPLLDRPVLRRVAAGVKDLGISWLVQFLRRSKPRWRF
ncbi:MAG: hypothetical protein M3022_09320 [Actinomycetota bacterium]|nr:hypothetical protein [Actinomycetota bacterium]